ncbi:hypothetical protein CQW23_32428 [Capsicum baccatum]|uniref:Pentatricopeptide repeat-containing protein n=1 Tax=Capsicum baccatum TaxID=33114 RepID=A0A2G2V4Q3_CAPBA|nr:hypothetical protein CQW23_32428 [Capsicum baccatum]
MVNSISHLLRRCGWSIHDIYKVFDGISQRDQVSWNSLINSLCKFKEWELALEAFRLMGLDGFKASSFTLVSIALTCSNGQDWYFGHCISYAVIASVLLGADVSQHILVSDPLATRRDALQSIVICLREGFRRKKQNSSARSSEGCGSSVKCSSSADTGHLGNATEPCTGDGSTWNNIEGINSDKIIDSGRPSLALRSSFYRSVVQETEVGSS